MVNKVEEQHKNKFRNYICGLSNQIRPRIELIKSAKGKDLNRSGLYNVGIIFNNKISEILHYYYEREIPFFNDAVVSTAVYDYLDNINQQAVSILNNYMANNMIVVDKLSALRRDNYPGLDLYKKCTEEIYEFDITSDIPKALKGFLDYNIENDNNFRFMFINQVGNIIDDVKQTLKELDLMEYYDQCEKIIQSEAVKCAAMIYDKQDKLYKKVYKK